MQSISGLCCKSFKFYGLGFRVQVQGLGFTVQGLRVEGLGFKVCGLDSYQPNSVSTSPIQRFKVDVALGRRHTIFSQVVQLWVVFCPLSGSGFSSLRSLHVCFVITLFSLGIWQQCRNHVIHSSRLFGFRVSGSFERKGTTGFSTIRLPILLPSLTK